MVVNKVDRPRSDPHGALDKTFDLFLELGATDEQADFPVVYGSALEGWIVRDPDKDPHEGMDALFETIIAEAPPPQVNYDVPFRMQVSTLVWSDYLGRIGCGRVLEGVHRRGQELVRTSGRGLIGYRGDFLTDARGMGIMSSRFVGYGPWCGEVSHRDRGSLVSMETGLATGYSLENLQSRGTLFVSPVDPMYAGMIIGEHSRPDDMSCNPTKTKKLGNYRSQTKDNDVGLKVTRRMTLDQALEWIAADELVEGTPKSVRVRKAVLDAEERKKLNRAMAGSRT